MDKAVTEEHMSDEFYHVSLRKPSGYVSRFVSFFPKSSGFLLLLSDDYKQKHVAAKQLFIPGMDIGDIHFFGGNLP